MTPKITESAGLSAFGKFNKLDELYNLINFMNLITQFFFLCNLLYYYHGNI
jgi:hypothetical protein